MYIRRTSIKSRRTGEPYYTYRLVESVRREHKVRQQTLINLGRHFDVPREQWAPLAQRIEQITQGKRDLFPIELDSQLEEAAQGYAAFVINTRSHQPDICPDSSSAADYQSVDIASLELLRPRSVGAEHVALNAAQQVGLDTKLDALGFNRAQCQAALATIIARMVNPASELATHQWLQQRSGLGELRSEEHTSELQSH